MDISILYNMDTLYINNCDQVNGIQMLGSVIMINLMN